MSHFRQNFSTKPSSTPPLHQCPPPSQQLNRLYHLEIFSGELTEARVQSSARRAARAAAQRQGPISHCEPIRQSTSSPGLSPGEQPNFDWGSSLYSYAATVFRLYGFRAFLKQYIRAFLSHEKQRRRCRIIHIDGGGDSAPDWRPSMLSSQNDIVSIVISGLLAAYRQ